MENKQKICDLLLVTLQNTRGGEDLTALVYDDTTELVTATFENQYHKLCNVACDSGCAMIRDIMKQLDI